jgi:hypothetical protein
MSALISYCCYATSDTRTHYANSEPAHNPPGDQHTNVDGGGLNYSSNQRNHRPDRDGFLSSQGIRTPAGEEHAEDSACSKRAHDGSFNAC